MLHHAIRKTSGKICFVSGVSVNDGIAILLCTKDNLKVAHDLIRILFRQRGPLQKRYGSYSAAFKGAGSKASTQILM